MAQTPRAFEGRSAFIDALRGIAALSVACYHIDRYAPLPEFAAPVIPGFLKAYLEHGWIGVQVFFVISGFVIAYSVRDARITPGYIGNYALRRSIRLDPPYWATIALVLLVHVVFSLRLGYESPLDVPSAMESSLSWELIAAHVFYVQNILADRFGFENLSAGFWTLCIEVQFYLLYVVGLGLAQQFSNARQDGAPGAGSSRALLALFGPLAVLSLFLWSVRPEFGPPEDFSPLWRLLEQLRLSGLVDAGPGKDCWITHFFCMFFLGILAWWTLDRRVPAWLFAAYSFLVVVRLWGQWSLDLSMALMAGLAIFLLGRWGRLGTALDYRWLQYLGRISYSLYLVHFPVSHVVKTLGLEHMSARGTLTPWGAAGWLVASLAASLITAHALYRFVEAPSVRLAARLKRS